MDTAPLNTFLRHLHLGSEVFYFGQLCDAWHMPTQGGDLVTFHLVCHGEAWLHQPGAASLSLGAGAIAFFAHDSAHSISALRHPPDDLPLSLGTPVPFAANTPGTALVCGHLKLPPYARRLLLAAFPDLLILHPDDSPVGRMMGELIGLMASEAQANGVGAAAVLDRLSDILFLYVIRHVLERQPSFSPLLAGLADETLRRALEPFIADPGQTWSVERMAELAFQSRSTFSERFTRIVGMPPMEFVATWRMQVAAGLLGSGNMSMLDVALRCGYESEAAFRKAFKRIVGIPPGQARG